jgi:hypothetical protein
MIWLKFLKNQTFVQSSFFYYIFLRYLKLKQKIQSDIRYPFSQDIRYPAFGLAGYPANQYPVHPYKNIVE